MPIDVSLILISFIGFSSSAVIIAVAGRSGGSWAASAIAFILWCGYTIFLRFWLRTPQYYSEPAWKFWLFGAALASVHLILVFLPMLLLTRFGWIPNGLIGGVAGAALAAWSYILVLLIVGCMLGVDCL